MTGVQTCALPISPTSELGPDVIALQRIARLRAAGLDVQPLYVEATALLREYIGARYDIPALKMTTEEIVGAAPAPLKTLQHCDLVKFARGAPEATIINRHNQFSASLYDLLEAYAAQRQRQFVQFVTIAKRSVVSLQEARALLLRMIGESVDWAPIDTYLIDYLSTPETWATAKASSLSAGLELVRDGHIEIRQTSAFSPLYVRRKPAKQTTEPESHA